MYFFLYLKYGTRHKVFIVYAAELQNVVVFISTTLISMVEKNALGMCSDLLVLYFCPVNKDK